MSHTTSKHLHFFDLPLEVRLPIYKECLPSALHINQPLPSWIYEGEQLVQFQFTSKSGDDRKLLVQSGMRSPLTFTLSDVLQREFRRMLLIPSGTDTFSNLQ